MILHISLKILPLNVVWDTECQNVFFTIRVVGQVIQNNDLGIELANLYEPVWTA